MPVWIERLLVALIAVLVVGAFAWAAVALGQGGLDPATGYDPATITPPALGTPWPTPRPLPTPADPLPYGTDVIMP